MNAKSQAVVKQQQHLKVVEKNLIDVLVSRIRQNITSAKTAIIEIGKDLTELRPLIEARGDNFHEWVDKHIGIGLRQTNNYLRWAKNPELLFERREQQRIEARGRRADAKEEVQALRAKAAQSTEKLSPVDPTKEATPVNGGKTRSVAELLKSGEEDWETPSAAPTAAKVDHVALVVDAFFRLSRADQEKAFNEIGARLLTEK